MPSRSWLACTVRDVRGRARPCSCRSPLRCPVVQLVPPTRTLKGPSSPACQVTSVAGSAGPIRVSETPSIVTRGRGRVLVTLVVVCEPWLPHASATQTRIVFAPSLRSAAFTVVVCWPARRRRCRSRSRARSCSWCRRRARCRGRPSFACHVTSVPVAAGPTRVSETASIATIGAVMSFTTLVVCEPWLPAASATQTRIAFAPSRRLPGAHGRDVLGAGAPVVAAALHLRAGRAALSETDADAHAVGAVLVRVPGDVGARVRRADQGVGDRVDHHRGRRRVLDDARRLRALVAGRIGRRRRGSCWRPRSGRSRSRSWCAGPARRVGAALPPRGPVAQPVPPTRTL